MSLRSRVGIQGVFKPPCPDYEAAEGSKRCLQFQGGGCQLDSHPACEPWVRVNPGREPTDPGAAAALKGDPGYVEAIRQDMVSTYRSGIARKLPAAAPEPPRAPASPASLAAPAAAGQATGWPTEADMAAFGELGVEMRIGSPSMSEDLWLVPAYTENDRLEMTAEDAIAVCKIVQAFPGATVADVIRGRRTPKSTPST